MTSVNPSVTISPDLLLAFIADEAKKHDKEDPKAALAQLAKTLEGVLASVASGTGKTDSKSNPSAPRIPTNAQMQQQIGQLMALLSQLQGEIAKYGEQNAEANAGIGQSLMVEMQAQVQKANEDLQNILKNQQSQDFWSTFTKVAEVVVGAVIATIAILCGQPELAAIVVVFTILAISGAMDKITDGLSDLISKALVNAGVPKQEADTIAKVLADVIIIAASIAVTVLTCGAGAGATAEAVADVASTTAEEAGEEAVEMADFAVDGEASASQAAESTESFTQKLSNFLSKVGNWIKENNIFNKLPKNINLGIVAGAQAMGSTNFGHDFMAAVLLNMKDKKTKEELETIFGTIINLLGALTGAAAGASVALNGTATSAFSNSSSWLKALMALQVAGNGAQFTGQVGSGVTYAELAEMTADQGRTQAILSEIQSLVSLNSQQSSSDTKSLNAKMKTWATELASLSHTLNLAGSAIAHELQA